MRAALIPISLLTACGLGTFDDQPGGRDNLPTRAAGPYTKLEIDFDTPADEPFVLFEVTAHYRDPSPLARTGGGFRIWFARQDADSEESEIWYAELPDVHGVPDVPPRLAVAADQEWEAGHVREPSVLDLGGGHLVMYYRGGADDPAIGRADSIDDGATWTKQAESPILDGAASPSAAALPGGHAVYFVSPGQPGIRVATGDPLVAEPEPIIAPRPDLAESFDALRVDEPYALVTRTLDATGVDQFHVGLFFVGTRRGPNEGELIDSIGYAGSYDGLSFDRFFGPDPVLDPGLPGEGAPGVIQVAAGGVLFFHESRQNRFRIGAAAHP
jgi:hypothetical protein